MSAKQILEMLTELDGYGIVVTEDDEHLIEAIETLGLADGDDN